VRGTQSCTYLIVGASHAGLAALDAIRMFDADSPLIMASRESHLPYSPTVLPYVVSGRSIPEKVRLRSQDYFNDKKVDFRRNAPLRSLDTEKKVAHFGDGTSIRFEHLLLATGASPNLPPIPGLQDVPFQVLRTMDDALALKSAMTGAKRALVLGGGLIGTHATENLAEAGLQVTLVEAKGQLLPGYFDAAASGLIAKAFLAHGIDLVFGQAVGRIEPGVAVLESGGEIPFDLLLVAAGVSPDLSYLERSGIKSARGILVDPLQRTSRPNIWAAGDCAESSLFQTGGTGVAGILPVAVEQGRIAGRSMAGDGAVKPFPGAVSLNTYTFFGQQAISVGRCADDAGCESHVRQDEEQGSYLRLDLKDGRLMGAAAVNVALDPGILWQLILRRTDLGLVKQRFLADPKSIGRLVMAREWK